MATRVPSQAYQSRCVGSTTAVMRGGAGVGGAAKVQPLVGLEQDLVLYESPQGFWIFLTWMLMLQIGAATAGVLLFMTPLGDEVKKAFRSWQLARVQEQIKAGTYVPPPAPPVHVTPPAEDSTLIGGEEEGSMPVARKRERSLAVRLLEDNGHVIALASIGFATVALVAARKILRGQLSRVALTKQHTLLVDTKSLIGRTRRNEISPYHIASTFHMLDGQFWFWLLHNNFGPEQVRPSKYVILQQSQLSPSSQRLLTKFLAQQPLEQRDIDACQP